MKKWLYLSLLMVPLLVLSAVFPVLGNSVPCPCTDTPEYCQVKVAQVPIPWQFWAVATDPTGATTVIDRIRISPTWLNPPSGQPAGVGPVLVSRQFAIVSEDVGVIPLQELVWDFETDMPLGPKANEKYGLKWELAPEEKRLLEQGLPPFIEVKASEDEELYISVEYDNSAVLVAYKVMSDAKGEVVGHFINEAVLEWTTVTPPVASVVEALVNFDIHNDTEFNVTNFELDLLGIDFTCENVTWALGFVIGTGEPWGANEENPLVVRPIEGGTEVKWIQPDRPLKPCEWLHGGLSFALPGLIGGVIDGVNVTVQGYWTVLVPCGARMTGGGSVFTKDGARVTHGFELHCDASQSPNNLEVNWGNGKKGANSFHLTELTSARCLDYPDIDEAPPVAGFDTYVGRGIGRLNGVDGATIRFVFTDEGEPGKNDQAAIVIWDADGNLVLTVKGLLKNGNHQAHPH